MTDFVYVNDLPEDPDPTGDSRFLVVNAAGTELVQGPTETARDAATQAAIDATVADYLPLAGGTVAPGPLIVPAPTSAASDALPLAAAVVAVDDVTGRYAVAGPNATTMEQGDTGWRTIVVWSATDTYTTGSQYMPSLAESSPRNAGDIAIRRVGGTTLLRLKGSLQRLIDVELMNLKADAALSGFLSTDLDGIPAGGLALATGDAMGLALYSTGSLIRGSNSTAGLTYTTAPAGLTWDTDEAWPATLPGTPA